MILTLIALAVLPLHVPAWIAMAAYALVCGPGALDAMEIGEGQAAAVASAKAASKDAPAVAA